MAASSAIGAREIARRVLQRVRRDEAYATLALAGEIERQRRVSDPDRRLATELVYGVLRRRGQLDAVIAARLSRPLRQVDVEVLDILRLAAYQLLVLDRVPAYAAVDEAVRGARRLRGKKVGAFVNAVLRRLQRETAGRPIEALVEDSLPPKVDAAVRLAALASLPLTLAREWREELGEEAAGALGATLLQAAPITLRANRRRISVEDLVARLEGEGVRVERGRYAPTALRVFPQGSDPVWTPGESASYHEGLWTVQDEGAQLVSLLLDPHPNDRLLDACCGLGGKTTHLAEIIADERSGFGAATGQGATFVAVDQSARKIELLDEHLLRLGLRCDTRQGDLTRDALGDDHRFDRILLDAPCSGLGVLRRHPELKWRQAAVDAKRRRGLVALQRDLLRAAVARLAPGWTIVYAVCTVTRAEGPEQLAWIRETFPFLELSPPRAASVLADLAPRGELTLWPHLHGTDGFYAVRLTRSKEA